MKENSIGDRIEEKYTRYINCETDILELTIEEAIFILEKDASVHYVEDLLQEAYKVILSDYKRVLEMNEILSKRNEVLLKKNEELKGLIAHKNGYTKKLEEDLFENSNNYVIPIQKVKDKIEEYKNMLKTCNKAQDVDRIKAINERVLELQELLEKE